MSNRHPLAFPDVAPPPGGLARLRARLDGRDASPATRRARALTFAVLPSFALAAALLFVVVRAPARPPLPDLPSLAKVTNAGAVSGGTRAIAVPLDGGVTLYWVP